jgi:long-chain-fatty-acid--CoA ligase ACSBG
LTVAENIDGADSLIEKMSKIRETRDFRVCEISKPTRILRPENAEHEPTSVPDLLSRAVEKFGDHPALAYQDHETKSWKFINYKEYKGKVDQFAKVFIKLGLKRFASVAVLAFNSVEWFITELAAIHAG